MVGQETVRVARRLRQAIFFGLAAALIATIPSIAAAQDGTAASPTAPIARDVCPSTPILAEAASLRSRNVPLVLPQDWLTFVSASRDWIAVRTQMGSVHCLETAWYDDASSFERFGDRFLGFEWQGYEAFGFVLIDTAGTGSSMDVGAKPMFSADKSRFATVQFSDAGYGGFEGFAVWRTYPGGITPEHVDTRLPYMADWRTDRWVTHNCLQLSAIQPDRIEDWENLGQYQRDQFVSGEATGWKLTPGSTCPTY